MLPLGRKPSLLSIDPVSSLTVNCLFYCPELRVVFLLNWLLHKARKLYFTIYPIPGRVERDKGRIHTFVWK